MTRSTCSWTAAKRDEMESAPAATRCRRSLLAIPHVGGCDELYALEKDGGLDPLLNG